MYYVVDDDKLEQRTSDIDTKMVKETTEKLLQMKVNKFQDIIKAVNSKKKEDKTKKKKESVLDQAMQNHSILDNEDELNIDAIFVSGN